MDIMELGAIGELIGGAAVIASLLFVGVQIRANARSMVASRNAFVADYNSFLMTLGSDPNLTKNFRRAVSNFNGLSNNERSRVHMALSAQALQAQNLFNLSRSGHIDRALADQIVTFFASLRKSEGVAQWWAHIAPLTDPDFARWVDKTAAEKTLPAVDQALPWLGLDADDAEDA